MTSKEKINSIKSVINEFYHDMNCKGNLTECANECWKEYQQFCEDIKKDLDRLEKLEKDIITTYEFNKKLREENTKLKKVIEILKEEFSVEFDGEFWIDILLIKSGFGVGACFGKDKRDKYNLLKEYFGNVKD